MSKKKQQKINIPVLEHSEPPTCSNCKYFKKIDKDYGYCKFVVSQIVNSKNLTQFGAIGTFIVMPHDELCGQHPNFISFQKDS